MKKTKIIVLDALLAAFASAILCLGSILGDLDLTFAAAAALPVFWAALELGMKSAWSVWAVASLTSLLLSPAKFAPVIFALFVGIYPIIKLIFERFRPILSWILKLAVTNAATVLLVILSEFIFFPSMLEAWWVYALILLLANIATVLFDYLLGRIAILYYAKIKKKLHIFDNSNRKR